MKTHHFLTVIISCTLLPWATASTEVNADESRQRPITITASTEGRFATGFSWYLSVNSAGDAELFVNAWPQPLRQKLVITRDQLVALSDALDREAFFDLKDEYGQHVPSGSTDILTIVRGNDTKTVRILFLMNLDQNNHELLGESARAVRVFNLIRNWFNAPEAVNLRRYDQMFLDAVEKKTNAQQSVGG